MNLEEQIEKAFLAGAEFVSLECYTEFETDLVECPNDKEINKAFMEYINGNPEPGENITILD